MQGVCFIRVAPQDTLNQHLHSLVLARGSLTAKCDFRGKSVLCVLSSCFEGIPSFNSGSVKNLADVFNATSNLNAASQR